MIIDQTDVAIIRSLEINGFLPEVQIKELNISEEELNKRINVLKKHGVISGFKGVIFVPKYLGGQWSFCCIFAYARNRGTVLKEICSSLPYVTEIWLNTNVPAECGHNLALLFYSQNVEQEVELLRRIKEISLLSWQVILKYEFPAPCLLTADEKTVLMAILDQPDASTEIWAKTCKINRRWLGSEVNSLLRWRENPDGIIQILPEVKFTQAENFAHCHFILECKKNVEMVFEELSVSGFKPIIPLNTGFQKYFQLENDIWGLADLSFKIRHLNSFNEIKLRGLVIAEEKRIAADWARNLLQQ
ncbi:MAG: hypothetical protein ABIK73_03060 [candidate division WOR-3 bacterium]